MNKNTIVVLTLAACLLGLQSTRAGSAAWKTNPADSNWNNASNWTPATVPNGATDKATFATSNVRSVAISTATTVNSVIFNAGASAFNITAATSALTLSGAGVVNNSGIIQNFVSATPDTDHSAPIVFTNSATAGSNTMFTAQPGHGFGGAVVFEDDSSAGTGAFLASGGDLDYAGGGIAFYDKATAADGSFVASGPTGDVFSKGGQIGFYSSSNAGNASITINGGNAGTGIDAYVTFGDISSAANSTITAHGALTTGASGEGHISFSDLADAGASTLIADGDNPDMLGGRIGFYEDSSGGTCRVQLTGQGNLDISFHFTSPGLTIGSLEGNGAVFLGVNVLTVGSNSLNTRFSGIIQDGGQNGGTAGSMIKIGSGALTLNGANTYSGGTQITEGALLVSNQTGSGSGTGPVQVKAGTLGGRGVIAGTVSVGDSRGQGGFLTPSSGTAKPNRLTIQSALTFNGPDGTYVCKVNTRTSQADQVIANGVTINAEAQFKLTAPGHNVISAGTAFTAINNTSATPISGTFSNLADGSTITIGSNTFQANYEGGDGNDLTLTVVP